MCITNQNCLPLAFAKTMFYCKFQVHVQIQSFFANTYPQPCLNSWWSLTQGHSLGPFLPVLQWPVPSGKELHWVHPWCSKPQKSSASSQWCGVQMDTLKVPHLKKRVNSMNKIKEIFPKQFCCIWKKKSNEGNCIKPYKFLWPMKNEMKTTDRDIIKCPRIIKRFDPLMYSTIISKYIRKCPFQLLILC